jgi:hypothetical protein
LTDSLPFEDDEVFVDESGVGRKELPGGLGLGVLGSGSATSN